MAAAIQKGTARPGGFPYVDRAPTGRARCLQCREAIDKGALRVAVEREIETGGMAQKSAGYLHPACGAAYAAEKELDVDELVAGLTTNSRIPELELAEVVATLQA
jgi:hypothetical protein